ncbi:hypothetical protein Tco_1301557, partial [Tanacetum coccineum]
EAGVDLGLVDDEGACCGNDMLVGEQVKKCPLSVCHLLSGQSVTVRPDMGTTQ